MAAKESKAFQSMLKLIQDTGILVAFEHVVTALGLSVLFDEIRDLRRGSLSSHRLLILYICVCVCLCAISLKE